MIGGGKLSTRGLHDHFPTQHGNAGNNINLKFLYETRQVES